MTATARTGNRSSRSHRALQPSRSGMVIRYIWLSIVAIACLFPFYAMVVLSLRPNSALIFPQSLIPWPLTGQQYALAIGTSNIFRWVLNTLVYSLVGVVAVLLLSSFAGYAFAKKRFRGKEVMFWSFIAMLMVPMQVTMIPLFVMVAKLGGVDTYWGLIVPTLANAQAVFLMRQFVQGLPDDLFDAAKIDGAGEMRLFFTIVMPLCKPVLATLGVFIFLWHWNDLLWPLIVEKTPQMWTLTVGIASLQSQTVSIGTMTAGSVVSLIPIFMAYLIAQRYVQEGVTAGSIKG